MGERIDIFINNLIKQKNAKDNAGGTDKVTQQTAAEKKAEKNRLNAIEKRDNANKNVRKEEAAYLRKRGDEQKKIQKGVVSEARYKSAILNKQAKEIETPYIQATNAAKAANEKEIKMRNRTDSKLASMGIDSTSKKNQALVEKDLMTNGKISDEMRRQNNYMSKRVGMTTRNAMNYLSLLFIGQAVSKMFAGLRNNAVAAYTELTKGSGTANGSLMALQATIKYIQFSMGAAIADFIAPWMDEIAYFAETLSDFISEHGNVVVTFMAAGTLLGFLSEAVAQIALLSASVINIKVISNINSMLASGTAAAAGNTAGAAAGKGWLSGLIPWFKTTTGNMYSNLLTFVDDGIVAFRQLGLRGILGAGGLATAIVSLALLVGWFANKFNTQIEAVTGKMGYFGDIINIVLDILGIAFNFLVIGLKTVTNLLAGIGSYLKDMILAQIESVYNGVTWIIEAVSKLEFPEFGDALASVESSIENIRADSLAMANDKPWFTDGISTANLIADSDTFFGITPYINRSNLESGYNLPDSYRAEQSVEQYASQNVSVASVPAFDMFGDEEFTQTLITNMSVENNEEALAAAGVLGTDIGLQLNTGFDNSSLVFKESVNALATETLTENLGGALEAVNNSFDTQAQQLLVNTTNMDSYAISTNNAAAAQERLNRAQRVERRAESEGFDDGEVQSYS